MQNAAFDKATSFPVIELKGSARARGHSYGEQCGDLIRAAWDYYNTVIFKPRNLGPATLGRYARDVQEAVKSYDPDLCTEMMAIAEASNQEAWKILALNSRTEILNATEAQAETECTAFCLTQERILAQNWDWTSIGLEVGVLLDITDESGARKVLFTEAGMVGKIGFNDQGFGLCLNILQAPNEHIGIPVHVLARSLLQSRDVAHAFEVLGQAPGDRSTNFLLADRHGGCASVEFAGSAAFKIKPDGRFLAHTNHFLEGPHSATTRDTLPGSFARLEQVNLLCSEISTGGVEAAKRVLEDQTDLGSVQINMSWRPSAVIKGEKVGTCAAIVFDLQKRTIHIRKGQDPAAPWSAIDIGG